MKKTFLPVTSCLLTLLLCGVTSLSVLADESCSRRSVEVIRPFDGKTFNGWRFKEHKVGDGRQYWIVGHVKVDPVNSTKLVADKLTGDNDEVPEMVNLAPNPRCRGKQKEPMGLELYTDQEFGDCTVELDFFIPEKSNSGVYMMGRYELQIRDDYGKGALTYQGMGGIYRTSDPKVNACRKFGQWQHYVIQFEAPRFQNGKKVKNARFVKVVLNGKVIQENVDVLGPTGSHIFNEESPTGPLMLQGHHGPVSYRNVKITILKN